MNCLNGYWSFFVPSQPVLVAFLVPSSPIVDVAQILAEQLVNAEVAPIHDLTPLYFFAPFQEFPWKLNVLSRRLGGVQEGALR